MKNNENNLNQNNENNLNENNLYSNKSNKSNKIIREIFSWISSILVAFILSFFILKFCIVNARVPSPSMVNTINVNDRFIANRLSYLFSEPERFDIVVFKYPDDEEILYVKRIIGLPGETVEIIDGKVYINGSTEPLRDDFIPEPMAEDRGNFGPYEVPEGHYFMLGDNRNHSEDSRYWQNKFVEKDKILGKAIFKYYPKIEMLTDK